MEATTSIFEVDEASDLPIWVQLRNRMAYLIRTGQLKGGEQLPSIRSLAADAKINYNTVTKAYRDLELEKLIVSVRGRGMYVQKNLATDDESSTTAIDAVLDFERHDYLFFCARPTFDGYHNFARTLREHNANARAYSAELNRRNIK